MTLLDVWIDDRLDQTSELFFKYPSTDPKAALLGVDQDVSYDAREWYVVEKADERNGTDVLTTIRCVAKWYRLGERIRVGSTLIEARTVAQGLETILGSTGWTVGEQTAVGGPSYSYEDQDQTVLALIRGWATLSDKVVVFDTVSRTVDLIDIDDRGVNSGMSFRYGRNLTSIKRRVEPPDVTRIYPFGRDDLNITGVSSGGESYIEDYSFYTSQGVSLATAQELYRKDEVWSNADITDEDVLLSAAQTRLAERSAGLIEYQMKVVDLTEIIGVNQEVNIGDTVRVSDSELGFDVSTTVVRRVHYPLQPWRDQIELSYLYDPAESAGSRNTRPKSGLTWELFQHRSALLKLRDNNTWVANRIGVGFSDAAEAIFGYDLTFRGVGTGTLSVTAFDAESTDLETGGLEHAIIEYPYEDGEQYHYAWSWSHDSSDTTDTLNGQKDYRIRMKAIPTGGPPATSLGVDIDRFGSRFWILARGAVKRTPEAVNTQRFEYNGTPSGATIQQFLVPDGVTEVEVELAGGKGGNGINARSVGGFGCIITVKIPVTAGETIDVWVPGQSSSTSAFPNGGGSDSTNVGNSGGPGGGSASIVRGGGAAFATSFADSIVVAPGGGGTGFFYNPPAEPNAARGFGGLFQGGDGLSGSSPGFGATQYAGGAAGPPAPGRGAGTDGSFGYGGTAADTSNNFAEPSSGGGGGWYGGGGTPEADGNGGGGGGGDGGGGSGWIDTDSVIEVVEVQDGAHDETSGYVEFRWNNVEV